METIALLLKSHAGDLEYARRLLASFEQFNSENLTLFCVVPDADFGMFAELGGAHVKLIAEGEALGRHLVDGPVGSLSQGYANQEIVKLSFWELGLTSNYFCVDSDAVFIRPFGSKDFMRDPSTPYSVLVEDNELKVEPEYFRQNWQGRESLIRKIMDIVELDDPIMRTSHGHQIVSGLVLQDFKSRFLQPRQWTYADAIEYSPYEFSWYAMWLQKSQVIAIHQREPLVKVFHSESQHLEYILRGVTSADIARGYLAVVVNSNYSRDLGVVSIADSKPEAIAPYLSYAELLDVSRTKVRDTWRRRSGRRGSAE